MITLQLEDQDAKCLLNWLNNWRNTLDDRGMHYLVERADKLTMSIALQYKKQGIMGKTWFHPEIPAFVFKSDL